MDAEHCKLGGSDFEFTSPNHSITTTPRREWQLVIGLCSPLDSEVGGGRRIPAIDVLLELASSKQAQLAYEEVASLVLYSGPMYVIYNAILRRHPEEVYGVMRREGNHFATTLHVLVSAVQKLSRVVAVPDGLVLYRGLGCDAQLPAHFFERDLQGCRGICEWGFMSTTSSLQVALRYSGALAGTPLPTLLAMRVGAVDRGACICEFSQYPAEMEYLWVPCSFLQWDTSADDDGTSVRLIEDGASAVSLVRVRVNGNLKAQTIDELLEGKKRSHLASFKQMLEEVKMELDETAKQRGAEARLEQEHQQRRSAESVPQNRKYLGRDLKKQKTWACLGTFGKQVPLAEVCNAGGITVTTYLDNIHCQCMEVYEAHEQLDAKSYARNPVYRGLVMEMLEVKAMAQSKLLFWLCDPTRLIHFAHDYPLRRAHRSRIAFLLRTLPTDSEKRKEAAVRLCQLKGLLRESVDDKNEMGETRILWAAAEGLSGLDLGLLLDARADPNALDIDGRTPIFVAASYGHSHCIKALALRGGLVQQARSDKVSPVWVAALNGFADCVAVLGELGADVNQPDEAGVTPALIAAEKGHADCIRALRRLGAKLELADNAGRTPLAVAAALPPGVGKSCVCALLGDESGGESSQSSSTLGAESALGKTQIH
jgi:hypothetical protein